MQVYLLQNGEKAGPFTVYEVCDLVRSGKADKDTPGWHAGCEKWKPLGELAAVSVAFHEREEPPEQEIEQEVSRPSSEEAAATLLKSEVRPGMRVAARFFDVMVFQFVVLIAALAFGLMEQEEVYRRGVIEHLSVPAAWVFLEAFLLMAFGTTPGKALFRIRVSTVDGSRIDMMRAVRRSFAVWWRGTGIWFPPFMIMMCALSYTILSSHRTTPWDAANGLKVTHGTVGPANIAVILLIFLSLANILATMAGPPPPLSELLNPPDNG